MIKSSSGDDYTILQLLDIISLFERWIWLQQSQMAWPETETTPSLKIGVNESISWESKQRTNWRIDAYCILHIAYCNCMVNSPSHPYVPSKHSREFQRCWQTRLIDNNSADNWNSWGGWPAQCSGRTKVRENICGWHTWLAMVLMCMTHMVLMVLMILM